MQDESAWLKQRFCEVNALHGVVMTPKCHANRPCSWRPPKGRIAPYRAFQRQVTGADIAHPFPVHRSALNSTIAPTIPIHSLFGIRARQHKAVKRTMLPGRRVDSAHGASVLVSLTLNLATGPWHSLQSESDSIGNRGLSACLLRSDLTRISQPNPHFSGIGRIGRTPKPTKGEGRRPVLNIDLAEKRKSAHENELTRKLSSEYDSSR